MRGALIATALLAFTTEVMAQPAPRPRVQLDHLVPEPGQMAMMTGRGFSFGYAEIFANAFPRDTRVFGILQLGPFPPSAIALRQMAGGYELLGAEVVGRSGGAWNTVPGRKETLAPCKARLEAAAAERVIAAWDRMVLQTRDDGGELPLGPDGATGHYASRLGNRIVSGWSGSNEGKPRRLFEIAFALWNICGGHSRNDAATWTKIDAAIAGTH